MLAAAGLMTAGMLHSAPPAPCAKCHAREAEHFAQTRMAQALHPASESVHTTLQGEDGGYKYEIAPQPGADPVYAVTDGMASLRIPLTWVVGQGVTGQTYLFEREGRWYESRLSFYPALPGLDLTMGAQTIRPHTLLEHAGRPLTVGEMQQCLQCHATAAGTPAMTPGVQCDRCHGGAEAHVLSGWPMRKLGSLASLEQSNFCGECHRTWAAVAERGPHDIQNLRFQPYRLTNSKCFDATDARIRCTACHDPHRELAAGAAAYDARCLACHSRTASPLTSAAKHTCRIGTRNCTDCYMPRLPLPGAHRSFTDHWIRVVRAGEPYPA